MTDSMTFTSKEWIPGRGRWTNITCATMSSLSMSGLGPTTDNKEMQFLNMIKESRWSSHARVKRAHHSVTSSKQRISWGAAHRARPWGLLRHVITDGVLSNPPGPRRAPGSQRAWSSCSNVQILEQAVEWDLPFPQHGGRTPYSPTVISPQSCKVFSSVMWAWCIPETRRRIRCGHLIFWGSHLGNQTVVRASALNSPPHLRPSRMPQGWQAHAGSMPSWSMRATHLVGMLRNWRRMPFCHSKQVSCKYCARRCASITWSSWCLAGKRRGTDRISHSFNLPTIGQVDGIQH